MKNLQNKPLTVYRKKNQLANEDNTIMPNLYEWILAAFSAISLLLSFLNFKDRRSKEQTENVSDQLEALNKSHKEIEDKVAKQIANHNDSQKAMEIKVAVLEERINNEIHILNKMNEKLDDYLK
jgi:hypothetical protein